MLLKLPCLADVTHSSLLGELLGLSLEQALYTGMLCYVLGATYDGAPVATCRAIAEVLGYKHCTAVQAESLGPLLSGADMVVKAKTGTGKTLAFLIPGIEQVGCAASQTAPAINRMSAGIVHVMAVNVVSGKDSVKSSAEAAAVIEALFSPCQPACADAQEPYKQEHWNAGDQPHSRAGSTDCSGSPSSSLCSTRS